MNWNDLLIQIDGTLYFANTNFASYELKFVESSNIDMLGYSEHQKELFVRFKNMNTYIYKDVPKEIFTDLIAPEVQSIGSMMNRKVKGFFRYEQVYWHFEKASPTEICKHYRNMQYTINIHNNLSVTDRIDIVREYAGGQKIIDKYFWKVEFTEQPENCQRIK